jgi:pyruvate dehydrogenase E2 component (dihydrolipoamide acetyltransferase)
VPDQYERLDHAERWLADSFRVAETIQGFLFTDIDMTRPRALLERLRARGMRATYNHLFVRAAAVALARLPEQHLMVIGTRRLRPGQVDIGLSVAGQTNYAPVMVIEDAARKTLPAIAEEILRRVPEVQEKERKDLDGMRKLGWLIPFGWLRRFIVRRVLGSFRLRRQLAGTFQISCLNVDAVVPMALTTAAGLGVGRVRDRAVVIDGRVEVRPISTVACMIDHKVWDGVRAMAMTGEVKKILEEGELEAELDAPALPASSTG